MGQPAPKVRPVRSGNRDGWSKRRSRPYRVNPPCIEYSIDHYIGRILHWIGYTLRKGHIRRRTDECRKLIVCDLGFVHPVSVDADTVNRARIIHRVMTRACRMRRTRESHLKLPTRNPYHSGWGQRRRLLRRDDSAFECTRAAFGNGRGSYGQQKCRQPNPIHRPAFFYTHLRFRLSSMILRSALLVRPSRLKSNTVELNVLSPSKFFLLFLTYLRYPSRSLRLTRPSKFPSPGHDGCEAKVWREPLRLIVSRLRRLLSGGPRI